MSERILRYVSILSWPIWLKLLLGFTVAIIVPVILVVLVIANSVQQVGRSNVENYISDNGARQRAVIESTFNQAQLNLNIFTTTIYKDMLLDVLPPDRTTFVNPITKAKLVTALQENLLNTGDGLYQRIELLDAEGRLVIQALPGRTQTLTLAEDRASTSAYGAGVNAEIQNQDYVVSISRLADRPIIEIVSPVKPIEVFGVSQPAVGYLVARLNVQNAVYNILTSGNEFLGARSLLVTPSGFTIDSDGLESDVIPSTSIQRALTGQSGLETFVQDGTERIRYYTPITGTPFVLVSEAYADVVSGQVMSELVKGGFALVVGLVFLVVVLVLLANQLLVPPLGRLRAAIQAMGAGNFSVPLTNDMQRGDEIGTLVGSFADARNHIQVLIADLEGRIAARVRDVSATQEISHYAATQRDLQQLMDQVVNLIIERFPNIYHAQIFLIDNERHYAVLRASTGDVGKRLLGRGHRLAVGSVSVIGQTTDQGAVVVARDTASSRVHKPNELLPDTLAELAIPLRVGTTIIGALDVQSKLSDTFTQDQINVLQTMADQIAIAIENARLYQESLSRLDELERARRTSSTNAWRDLMTAQRTRKLQSEAGVRTSNRDMSELRRVALETGKPVIGEPTERKTIPIAVPIRLLDQILGAVEWELPQDDFDNNKVQLAQELTDRLAVSLENARLFHESQRATERERLVNDIAARLTSQTDIDQILQTAVREVGQALRSPQVSIRLNRLNESGETNGTANGNGHS